ncbi:MAG TPA: hypothetical protein IAA29_06575 [Candidatus Paenibacillus intestinavium]|nr:hypothetical protein [Candidatus Paenibacillus intestinavium]
MLEQVLVEAIDSYSDDKLKQGEQYNVKAHPFDKSMWYIVSDQNDWSLHEKWKFNHLVDRYAVCEKYYGLFQLPILEEEKFNYSVILPSGYVSMISKETCIVESYPYIQKINCGDVRFR